MRVGLLGGSFDPIHFGHLRAAEWAKEAFRLDVVRLVPALQSPFKGPSVASPAHRAEMLRRAIEDNPGLAVETCELDRDPPSFTVETLRTLALRETNAELVLIVGSDAAKDIQKWREYDEIRRLAEIRVLLRPGEAAASIKTKGEDLPFEGLSISSTAVRSAIREGRSIRYLTPEPVRRFIDEKGLYK